MKYIINIETIDDLDPYFIGQSQWNESYDNKLLGPDLRELRVVTQQKWRPAGNKLGLMTRMSNNYC